MIFIFLQEKDGKGTPDLGVPTGIWNQTQSNPGTLWAIRSILLELHKGFACIYKTDKVESFCFRVICRVEIMVKWHPHFESTLKMKDLNFTTM